LNNSLQQNQKTNASSKHVAEHLQNLHLVLQENVKNQELNARIADYVFFPLAGIFRDRQRLPVRLLELGLQCLRVLLKSGWSTIRESEVAFQLLILLTFLADVGGDQDSAPATSEGLRQAALECLTDLYASVDRSRSCKKQLMNAQHVPAIAHAVSVMLDNIKAANNAELQAAAAEAIIQFMSRIASPDVLKNFLPGFVSTIVQAVAPRAAVKLSTCRKKSELDVE